MLYGTFICATFFTRQNLQNLGKTQVASVAFVGCPYSVAYCTDITISADTPHDIIIIATQGARVGLLSLRLYTDRTTIQLQPVSFLLV